MPSGQPLVEATGSQQVDLVNFPGDDLDLLSVFKKNAETLIEAFGGTGYYPFRTQYPVTVKDLWRS